MRMNRTWMAGSSVICLLFCLIEAKAQSDPLPKFEAGVLFTTISKSNYSGTEPGVGGRFTFNLNRSIALEAEGSFFPRKCGYCGDNGDNGGNIAEALFGVKARKVSKNGASSRKE